MPQKVIAFCTQTDPKERKQHTGNSDRLTRSTRKIDGQRRGEKGGIDANANR